MTTHAKAEAPQMVVRRDLDFGLDGDIPRFWFAGDPFKTRFYDAFSATVPAGERFFIESMRDYRDQASDPVLREEMQIFIAQEGQHSMVHRQSNARLQQQGVAIERFEADLQKLMTFLRRHLPMRFSMAVTAAFEHLTATASHCAFDRPDIFASADRRMMAMFLWHSAEEIEHKNVAFDAATKLARAGYLMRAFAMLFALFSFSLATIPLMEHMLRVDGFGFRQRIGIWLRGLRWYYGKDGPLRPVRGYFLGWFKPGFHPCKDGERKGYERWYARFNETGDPMVAFDAIFADVKPA